MLSFSNSSNIVSDSEWPDKSEFFGVNLSRLADKEQLEKCKEYFKTDLSLLFRIRRFFIGILRKSEQGHISNMPRTSHSRVCKDCKLESAPHDSFSSFSSATWATVTGRQFNVCNDWSCTSFPNCSMTPGEITHFTILSFVRFLKERMLFMIFSNSSCAMCLPSHRRSLSSCTSGARKRTCASPALIASQNFGIGKPLTVPK